MNKRAFMHQHYIEDFEELYIAAIYRLRDLEEKSHREPGHGNAVSAQRREVMTYEVQCRKLRYGY
jgi:hypothetical protein